MNNFPQTQDELKAWVRQRAKIRYAAARSYQREFLRDVDDDTLREMHKKALAVSLKFDKSQEEMVIGEAIAMEVDRRIFSAGWFWNRCWRRPEDYKKWVAHQAEAHRILQATLALMTDRAA